MSRPQPGEYLFVGGPANGERRHVKEPYPIIQVAIGQPGPKELAFSNDTPLTAKAFGATYRMEQLNEGRRTFIFYVCHTIPRERIFGAIFDGYGRTPR